MAGWPVLVFDIETIPDIAGLRALRAADAAMPDGEVLAQELAERKAAGKSDFLPLHLQRVVVISCVFRHAKGLAVHSFVDRESGGTSEEGAVVQTFFDKVEKHQPQLVSWNGGGFDLPVLHYRGLRHLDLMDLLAMYQPRASAPLDAMAKLCGFPGKLGMDGSQVYPAYVDGRLEDIRRYCETDVMNTYLVYCRFQKMRGGFTEAEYAQEIAHVRETLAKLDEPHWAEYLSAWT